VSCRNGEDTLWLPNSKELNAVNAANNQEGLQADSSWAAPSDENPALADPFNPAKLCLNFLLQKSQHDKKCFFFLLAVLDLNSGPTLLATPSVLFCDGLALNCSAPGISLLSS
jgi:hypothetical protein